MKEMRQMSSAPTPPTISSGRAILVTGGFVITSALVLARLWSVLVPACEDCGDFLSSGPAIVSLMVTTAVQGTYLPYFLLLQLFSSNGASADSRVLIWVAWTFAPLVFAGAYWLALLRLRRVSALRAGADVALLTVTLFAIFTCLAQRAWRDLSTVTLSIFDTYLRVAVIALAGAALAFVFALLLADWRAARAYLASSQPRPDRLPDRLMSAESDGRAIRAILARTPADWSSPIAGLRVLAVILVSFFAVSLAGFLAFYLPLIRGLGAVYTLLLACQFIPVFLIVILATRNTLRLFPVVTEPASTSSLPATRIGGGLSGLGGALSIIGHFAPWALLTGAFLLLDSCGKQSRYNTTPTGADLTWQSDLTLLGGMLTIGAAITALVIGVGALRRQPTAPITLFLLVVTLVSAGILVYEAALLIGGVFPFYGAPDIEFVQFEPGFWMSAAGAALSLTGAVILLMVSRRDPTVATERAPAREVGATKQSAS
jgi:hypothetical protein